MENKNTAPYKILVVDSDERNLTQLAHVIKNALDSLVQIYLCHSVEDALKQYEKIEDISLVITELVFNWNELIDKLAGHVAIVVCTYFYHETEYAISRISLGKVQGYLDKNNLSSFLIKSTITKALSEFTERPLVGATVEFKRSVWGQLIPIEKALSSTLGDEYLVEKTSDRIVVRIWRSEQIQALLDALIPVLASLESVSEGEIRQIVFYGLNSEPVKYDGHQISEKLSYLCERFDSEFPRLSLAEETLIEGVKALPAGGILEPSLKRWFGKNPSIAGVSKNIYLAFNKLFDGATAVFRLANSDRDRISDETGKSIVRAHNKGIEEDAP